MQTIQTKRIVWEYTSFQSNTIENLIDGGDLKKLQKLGLEGWELVFIDKTPRLSFNAVVSTPLQSERTYLLKRPSSAESSSA